MITPHQRRELHNFIQQVMLTTESPEQRGKAVASWCSRFLEEPTSETSGVRDIVRRVLHEEKEEVRNRLIYTLNSIFEWSVEEKDVAFHVNRVLEEINKLDQAAGKVWDSTEIRPHLLDDCFRYELRRQLTSWMPAKNGEKKMLVEVILDDVGFFQRYPVEVGFWTQHFLAVERYHREEAVEQEKRVDTLQLLKKRLEGGGRINSLDEFLLFSEDVLMASEGDDLETMSKDLSSYLAARMRQELFPHVDLEQAVYFTLVAHKFCLAENVTEEDLKRIEFLKTTRELFTLRDLMLLIYDQVMTERRLPLACKILDRLQTLGFSIEHKDFRDVYRAQLVPLEDTVRYESKKLHLFLDLPSLTGDLEKDLGESKSLLNEVFSQQVRKVHEALGAKIEAETQPLPKAELIKNATIFAINWVLGNYSGTDDLPDESELIEKVQQLLSGPLMKMIRPRKGYEFKNKGAFQSFLGSVAAVHLESLRRVLESKKVNNLFDFKYFCRWCLFRKLSKLIGDKKGEISITTLKEAKDSITTLGMDYVTGVAHKEGFDLDETYHCSPKAFHKFFMSYIDVNTMVDRVIDCCGEGKEIAREEMEEEVFHVVPEWSCVFYKILVATQRQEAGMPRLSAEISEIRDLTKLLSPAFCHLEEIALERGRNYLKQEGSSLLLPRFRPYIETAEEFRAYLQYKIDEYVRGSDLETFSIANDLKSLKSYIEEELSKIDRIPDLVFPESIHSLILEVIQPVDRAAEEALSDYANQLLRLLPRSNCGGCGETACLAFAYGLLQGRRKASECQQMSPDEARSLAKELSEIGTVLGMSFSENGKSSKASVADGGRGNIPNKLSKVFCDVHTMLKRQIFWERLREIFEKRQTRLQIYKKPSYSELYEAFKEYLGFEATERLRPDEKDFLVRSGEKYIEAGWDEFFDTYDWFHRVQMWRQSAPYVEEHDALHRSEYFYRDKLFLSQLSEFDRELVLNYRVFKHMDGFSGWWNEDLLLMSDPDYQIQDWEDFSKIIKNAYWHQESSPSAGEIYRSLRSEIEGDVELSGEAEETLIIFVKDKITEICEQLEKEKQLVNSLRHGEKIDELGKLDMTMNYMVKEVALKGEYLPELSLTNRINAVFLELDSSGIEIDPELVWRWEDLPEQVRDYIEQSRVVDRAELTEFQRSKEGRFWKEIVSLREALLKGFIYEKVKQLEYEEIEAKLFEEKIRGLESDPSLGHWIAPGSLFLRIDHMCRHHEDPEKILRYVVELYSKNPVYRESLLEDAIGKLIRERQLLIATGESSDTKYPKSLVNIIDEKIRSRQAMDRNRLLHYLFILAKMEGNLDTLTALLREIRETSDIIEAAWLNFTTERSMESPKPQAHKVPQKGIPLEATNLKNIEALNRYLVEGLPRGEKAAVNRAYWELINVIRFFILKEVKTTLDELDMMSVEREVTPEGILELIKGEGYILEGLSEEALLKCIRNQIERLPFYADQKIWIFTTVTARKCASENQELLEVEKEFYKKKNNLLKASEDVDLPVLAELAAKRGVELGKLKEAVYYQLSDLLEDERMRSFQRRIRQIVDQLDEKRVEIYTGWINGQINRRTIFYLLRRFQKEKKVAQWEDFQRFILDQRILRLKKLEESTAPDAEEMREALENRFKALLGVDLRDLESEASDEAKRRLEEMREEMLGELETAFADDYLLEDLTSASEVGASKSSSFICVKVEKDASPQLLMEISLEDSKDHDISWEFKGKLSEIREALLRQISILNKGKELTKIKEVKVWDSYIHAAHLDPADTANFSYQALKYMPTGDIFLADHLEAHALMNEPQDSRIPPKLEPLVEEICAIRHSLEEIRNTFGTMDAAEREIFPWFSASNGILDPGGEGRSLIRAFMSRNDWRERDIFDMILEFIGNMPQIYGGLKDELAALESIRHEDAFEYDRIITGMISEARANLEGVAAARRFLQIASKKDRKITSRSFRLMIEAMALAMGIPEDTSGVLVSNLLKRKPVEIWSALYQEGLKNVGRNNKRIEMKNFERASLFLLPELKPGDLGHLRFCRSLIESTSSYNKILAGIYASETTQTDLFLQEAEKFNRLPENAETPVEYTRDEIRWWLRIFYLRPDVVEAIYNREKRKDMYTVISGLGPRAYLPRVLHEVQSVFGYVTPEAFLKIVSVLDLDATDVIKVIASYKEFSADPSGDIIIYICKGTACFLRGQPHISRTLSSVIGADRGQVADCGIQYIEMDCFGVCHMAPVMKAGDTFIPSVDPDSVPNLVEELLRGVSYENRVSFLNRIRKALTRGHLRVLRQRLRITEALNFEDENGLIGCGVAIDAKGRLSSVKNGVTTLLGYMVPRSFSFEYFTTRGEKTIGSLILDDANQVTGLVNYRDLHLEDALKHTMKPLAMVREGNVAVRLENDIYQLGEINSNTVVVKLPDGKYGALVFDGPNAKAVLEEEKGIPTRRHAPEDPAFIRRQDRVLLGFASGMDPDNIDSYIEHGGFKALRMILGLDNGKRWTSEQIIKQIKESNLRGRGGAGFPTGRKWEGLYRATVTIDDKDENKDQIKLIVANGDEGDPGAFMDRTLIQERPHLLVEGMIIAALAINARYGIIYVRKEYEDAVRRIENALFQARRRGYLGKNICGIEGLNFDLEIRLGAGAFVAGEKRAIMRAIEGKPAEPTLKAVSNARRGLWGKPTLLNNVETFANVPLIIQKGGRWFKRQGYKNSGGTKIFSVAGIVKKTGLVEVRFGRTLKNIIDICGGIKEGKNLAGVQIGGPSGAILSLTGIREYLLHTPLDFDMFNQVGAMLGSGGLVFIGEDDDVVRLARHFTDWLEDESCGQCPSCLGGTASLGRSLDTILNGEGLSYHIHALWAKGDAVKAGSQCGLGKTSANPVTSALRFFPQSFLHYLLMNPKLNRLELFKCLEALRLLTRENVEIISKRKRVVVGHVFTLRKGMVSTYYQLLRLIDRYKAPKDQRAWRFLQLLGIEEHEAGKWDVTGDFSLEEFARHEEAMKDTGYDLLRPAV